ncbi:uncharacterized protein LOC129969069 [Argiope bruennichi]|uniref:uncharacterized protein LOC129969069 n=1 Tax=Argiope bruennichi TaxID=94029 RepID=UPI002494CFE9|nr:uncharacterized protein LOC129969069 [Argiope bruennichi]
MGPKNFQQRTEIKKTKQIYFDHFFVIKRLSDTNETFHTVSPFLVEKAIVSVIGEVPSIRKLRSGDLLVEVGTQKQSHQILKMKALATIPIEVSTHSSLNSSKGVITCGELYHSTIEEITEDLKSEGVTHVRRIFIRRDGQLLPTKHLVLTFQSPTLPEKVKAGYMKLAVRPFIPNPLRCYQCQRFGHSKISCRGTPTCARCAEKGHDSQQCTAQEKCVNCSGDHTSFSRSCPRWQLEKDIIALKTKEQISYVEAKRKILAQTPKPGLSYATASKVPVPGNFCTNCSCMNCTKFTTKTKIVEKTSESETEPSSNSVPDTDKPTKRKTSSKSQRSLKLKLSKSNIPEKMISEKLKAKLRKSKIKNSVALGLANQGVVHRDLASVFGGMSKSPDLITLHPSEEDDEELQMSCDATHSPTTVSNTSTQNKLS